MIPDSALTQLFLDGETDVIIRRRFTHGPERVWRALTEPALIRQWLAPRDAMTRCEMDARPGGSFRYDWREFHFSGPILEALAPRHMVHVEHFNGDTTQGPTVTTRLVADGSGTRMTVVMRYRDATARAMAIEQGFTDGIDRVYGQIEDLAFPG
jgi:uncharacterized protein YndB with AHSA1/START domain